MRVPFINSRFLQLSEDFMKVEILLNMLRLISYLSPSIPEGFYQTIAAGIRKDLCCDVQLQFEERISGPLAGDINPFAEGNADIGFVCSPTFKYFRNELELLPLPVPVDERASGRAVYFSEITVHRDSDFQEFGQLRGKNWALNDKNSQSGWFSMLDRIAPEPPEKYFSYLTEAGSHLESIRLLENGEVDAAGLDSNVLRYYLKNQYDPSIRIIESLGPFPIQPVVIRKNITGELKQAVRKALLRLHENSGDQLQSYGFNRFIEPEDGLY